MEHGVKTMEFTVTHSISTSPEQLFDVWLDGDSPRGPWVGNGARRLDPVVGGVFYWADKNWTDLETGGGDWPHYGRFLRIERPQLVEFTWVSEFTHGLDSVVTVAFRETEGGTEVTLRHSGLPDDQAGLDHKNAWIRILGNVGAHFSASVSGQ